MVAKVLATQFFTFQCCRKTLKPLQTREDSTQPEYYVFTNLPERRIQALQQVGDRFIVAAHEGDANFLSLRGQGRAADGRYFTDRVLTARIIEECLDMFESRDG